MSFAYTVSSVAQLFGIGGGGGSSPPNVPTTTTKVHVTYMRERAKRASSSEIYRPIFSGLKIHLHTYTTNAVPFCYLWYGAMKMTTVSDKTLTLRKIYEYASERGASELGKFFAFSHSKTAISFNILLVLLILYLRNIYIFTSQITSAYYIHIVGLMPEGP